MLRRHVTYPDSAWHSYRSWRLIILILTISLMRIIHTTNFGCLSNPNHQMTSVWHHYQHQFDRESYLWSIVSNVRWTRARQHAPNRIMNYPRIYRVNIVHNSISKVEMKQRSTNHSNICRYTFINCRDRWRVPKRDECVGGLRMRTLLMCIGYNLIRILF